MIQHAVDQGLLSEESYGSTPGKMAASAIVQKLICVDQLRLERRAGGLFDCDASGCYDRIIPLLASVHLQALGLHHTIGTFLARMMFMAKRYVRTKHEVSTSSIGTTKANTLHGIGQGNGGGPGMWISHLTIMFSALSAVCWGFVLKCVQNISAVTTVGTEYVDDVTLGLTVPEGSAQTESNVRQHIKRMAQLWEQLLYITGGRLELSKCFWVPISWKWNQGVPRMVRKIGRNKELFIKESESKEYVCIPHRLGSDSDKRLGVWSSCDGLWVEETRQWIDFSRTFGKKVRKAGLGRKAGLLAYQSMWLAKFRYSAPVIGFTVAQCSKVQQSIISPCLSAAGYCNKMPRAVVYGPIQFGGMDWDNCGVVLLYEKLKLLIGSVRLQDKVGKLIEMQLTWLQIFAGSSTPVLQSEIKIPYLPWGWLNTIHHHLVQHQIQVEVWNSWVPTIQSKEDSVIMDVVHHRIPSWAWTGINRCRLFLQANTITDLTTIDGLYIPVKIRNVVERIRDSKLIFPIQQKPSKRDIQQWQFLLTRLQTTDIYMCHWVNGVDCQTNSIGICDVHPRRQSI